MKMEVNYFKFNDKILQMKLQMVEIANG